MLTRRQLAIAAVGTALALSVFALVFFLIPGWVVTPDEVPDAAERESLQNDVRTAGLQVLGGLVLAVGAVFTARTYLLGREGQITERFTNAVEQLGHGDLSVRLGGIFALERIAHDSARDRVAVVEVLTAYVRVHAPWPSEHVLPGGKRADVSGAMDVLGRTGVSEEDWQGRFRLDWVDLREGTYSGDFRRYQLVNAHFEAATLRFVLFSGARLRDSHFEGADLSHADFRDASLVDLEMREAKLDGARLQGAAIVRGTLRGVTLSDVHLEGANLRNADLEETVFAYPHVDGAILWPPGFDISSAPR